MIVHLSCQAEISKNVSTCTALAPAVGISHIKHAYVMMVHYKHKHKANKVFRFHKFLTSF